LTVVALYLVERSALAETAPSVIEVGWWTRSPVASAPNGGIDVAAGPDGPTSVAAVRVDLGDSGVRQLTLQLHEAGGTLMQTATLRVCPTSKPWLAISGGALADAPPAECDLKAVDATRDAQGSWTVDVTPLVQTRTGTVSLAVVPGAGAVFDLQLQRPTPSAALAAAPTPSASNGGATLSAPSPTVPIAASATPTFVTPAPSTPTASTPAITFAPAAANTATFTPTAVDPAVGGRGGSLLLRIIGFSVLSMAVGAAAGFARNRLRPAIPPPAVVQA
jgi:hypothetical protein